MPTKLLSIKKKLFAYIDHKFYISLFYKTTSLLYNDNFIVKDTKTGTVNDTADYNFVRK